MLCISGQLGKAHGTGKSQAALTKDFLNLWISALFLRPNIYIHLYPFISDLLIVLSVVADAVISAERWPVRLRKIQLFNPILYVSYCSRYLNENLRACCYKFTLVYKILEKKEDQNLKFGNYFGFIKDIFISFYIDMIQLSPSLELLHL